MEWPKTTEEFENLLKQALLVAHGNIWDALRSNEGFLKPKPVKQQLMEVPREPQLSDRQVNLGWVERLLMPKKINKENERINRLYEDDLKKWRFEKARILAQNDKTSALYEEELRRWNKEKEQYLLELQTKDIEVDRIEQKYRGKNPEGIEAYCRIVLHRSKYPEYFPREFDLVFNSSNNILVVDYLVPSPDVLPKYRETRFLKTKGEYRGIPHSAANFKKVYDSLICQIALRTIFELFATDEIGVLEGVVFNGWVDSIDKSTGTTIRPCILSVQVSRIEFSRLNLSLVDPKACITALKGIRSSELHSLTPIAPLLTFNREDKRFIAPQNVIETVNESIINRLIIVFT